MNPIQGVIVAADGSEKTFTVMCSGGVNGIEIGRKVTVIPLCDAESEDEHVAPTYKRERAARKFDGNGGN
jgi:hypothetical protein